MHNSTHHAGADNHTHIQPDRLARTNAGADTHAHPGTDADRQPEPDGNGQPFAEHLITTVPDPHRLTRRGR